MENELLKLFKGRMQVNGVSAYLYFDKGLSAQKILHDIKYKENQNLARVLGNWYGVELRETLDNTIDWVIPVPLHPKKLKQRGFNQSEAWAEGLAESLDAKVLHDGLIRTRYTSTQTKKSRTQRQVNVEKAFKSEKEKVLNSTNVLLVDDVITTGATLESCGMELWQIGVKKLFIATIAYAAL